jgi:hypothetical protein
VRAGQGGVDAFGQPRIRFLRQGPQAGRVQGSEIGEPARVAVRRGRPGQRLIARVNAARRVGEDHRPAARFHGRADSMHDPFGFLALVEVNPAQEDQDPLPAGQDAAGGG